jgi:hypothetical protein
MSLARAWRRQLFGASGAALLVPGTIAGALVVLALAGGFSRLGAIGQALSGPAAPVSLAAMDTGAARASAHLRGALAALGPGRAPAVGSPAAARGSGGTASGGGASSGSGTGNPGVGGSGHGGAGGSGGTGGSRGGSGGTPGGSGSGSGAGAGAGSGGGGAGAPGAPPTVVDGVVSASTKVTANVPGPVGTVATTTLQALGSTLDRVLPLRLPGGGAAGMAVTGAPPKSLLP